MTETVKEQLSACLDGELPAGEVDLLLKRFDRDAELRDTLGRYALIAQALEAKQPVAASAQFASKVMAAIDGEAIPAAGLPKRAASGAMRWLRPVAGFAVAAGVATVAILSLQQPGGGADEQVASVPPAISEEQPPGSYIVPEPPVASTDSLVPATRLTNYVVAHSEYSSPLGRVLADEDVEDAEQVDDSDEAAAGQVK